MTSSASELTGRISSEELIGRIAKALKVAPSSVESAVDFWIRQMARIGSRVGALDPFDPGKVAEAVEAFLERGKSSFEGRIIPTIDDWRRPVLGLKDVRAIVGALRIRSGYSDAAEDIVVHLKSASGSDDVVAVLRAWPGDDLPQRIQQLRPDTWTVKFLWENQEITRVVVNVLPPKVIRRGIYEDPPAKRDVYEGVRPIVPRTPRDQRSEEAPGARLLGEEPVPAPVDDGVHHPAHYNSHPAGIECITVIEVMSFNVGSAVKYAWRHGLKPGENAVKDLKKAIFYLEREVERLGKEPSGG